MQYEDFFVPENNVVVPYVMSTFRSDKRKTPPKRGFLESSLDYIPGVCIMNRNSWTAAFDSGRRLSIPS